MLFVKKGYLNITLIVIVVYFFIRNRNNDLSCKFLLRTLCTEAIGIITINDISNPTLAKPKTKIWH